MVALAENRPKSRLEMAIQVLTGPESPGSGEDVFKKNGPPFVTDLLADLNEVDPAIRKGVLDRVEKQSHEHDIPYLMTMMMRQAGDQTGLMGPLIGQIQNPKDALARIDEEGTFVLAQINELPEEERQTIIAMFNREGKANLKAVLTLDRILYHTDLHLKSRGLSQEARDFRDANEDALKALYRDNRRKQTLAHKHSEMNQKLKDALSPIIIYDETGGSLHQQYLLPAMPVQNQEMLEAILPEEISQTDWPVSPSSRRGVLFFLNMAGHPAARAAAEVIQELLIQQKKNFAKMDADQVRLEAIVAMMQRWRPR